ncbi:hypothetical protein QAD02_001463 [Eretmocerus hayati]|uniref:Uncharacterized protein n=1 Tax=Eretmocerus hayati TaxID=131215 RepID=A0ACC2NIP7_9HYME|nr:hypothetical protein QAD02_001463 [Eretmocerus hayati]
MKELLASKLPNSTKFYMKTCINLESGSYEKNAIYRSLRYDGGLPHLEENCLSIHEDADVLRSKHYNSARPCHVRVKTLRLSTLRLLNGLNVHSLDIRDLKISSGKLSFLTRFLKSKFDNMQILRIKRVCKTIVWDKLSAKSARFPYNRFKFDPSTKSVCMNCKLSDAPFFVNLFNWMTLSERLIFNRWIERKASSPPSFSIPNRDDVLSACFDFRLHDDFNFFFVVPKPLMNVWVPNLTSVEKLFIIGNVPEYLSLLMSKIFVFDKLRDIVLHLNSLDIPENIVNFLKDPVVSRVDRVIIEFDNKVARTNCCESLRRLLHGVLELKFKFRTTKFVLDGALHVRYQQYRGVDESDLIRNKLAVICSDNNERYELYDLLR